MAGLNVNMTESMRQFVDDRTRQLDHTTPTEYVRSLIREDQRRREMELHGPLIEKWLLEGELSPDEERSLPPGLLDRARRNLKRMIQKGLEGDGIEMTAENWAALKREARARAGVPEPGDVE